MSAGEKRFFSIALSNLDRDTSPVAKGSNTLTNSRARQEKLRLLDDLWRCWGLFEDVDSRSAEHQVNPNTLLQNQALENLGI